MKKLTLLALMLIPLLCLLACAAPDAAGESGSAGETAPAGEAAGETVTGETEVAGETAAAGENEAEAYAAAREVFACPEGYTDPSAIAVDESILSRADGLTLDWDAAPEESGEGGESAPAQFDLATWPDNEYTAGLPLPSAGSVSMSGEDPEIAGAYSILLENMPYESFLAYVELIKAAGFTGDVTEEDYSQYGLEGMSYRAREASGRYVELIYSGGTAFMLITLG